MRMSCLGHNELSGVIPSTCTKAKSHPNATVRCTEPILTGVAGRGALWNTMVLMELMWVVGLAMEWCRQTLGAVGGTWNKEQGDG